MAKMSKKRIALWIIVILVGTAAGLRIWKGKEGPGVARVTKAPTKIFEGRDRERVYKQRFVAGEKDVEDKIAIINVQGEISNTRLGFSSRGGMVDELIEQLKQAERDGSVKGIILKINSPGGPVIDADILYTKIMEVAKKKITVALLDRTAASGGYYVACGAHKIVSHPLTITGNIGVIMDHINLQGLLEKKLGIEVGVIKSGKYKDIGSPFRSMDGSEKKMLQELVDAAHRRFVGNISVSRKIPIEKLASLADGRIYSGEQAKKLGLVDELGTQDEAITLAKKLIGIEKAKVVEYYYRPRLMDFLFSRTSGDFKMKEIAPVLEPVLKYLWQPFLEGG